MAFQLVGILCAYYIIKRGLWKIRHIDHNRKLIKDEDWKDIHMTVRDALLNILSFPLVPILSTKILNLFRAAMMHFG